MNRITILLLLLWIIIPVSATVFAEEEATASKKSVFLDLDGDGINDNASDLDNDGIPDLFGDEDSNVEIDTSFVTTSITSFGDLGVSGTQLDTPTNEVAVSNSKAFDALCATVSPLMQQRGGVNSGDNFGPANALSGGGGVVCEGGVCRPR